MQRFNCRSELLITCGRIEEVKTLCIVLSHSQNHTPYFDVSIPSEAIDLIRDNIDWALPNDIIGKVQLHYQHVTAKQITTVWTKFAQNSWKRNPKDQMDSARQLLREFSEEVDILEVDEETLGAKGYLTSGYIEITLRFFKQCVQQVSSRYMLITFKKYPSR